MIKAVKALAGSVTGIVTLGLGYMVLHSEVHYWMQPNHLPVVLTVAGALTAAGVGGAAKWGKDKVEERKERKATEELADIREQLRAKQALPESTPTVIDLGHVNRARREA